MTTQPTCFRAVALAALALFATTAASQAQGLGGMLNKAKAKVSQATQATSGAASVPAPAAAQAAQGSTGNIPESPSPDNLTAENNAAYARTVLANRRPWVKGQGVRDDDYAYRRLRDEFKMPIKFTWDQGFVAYITKFHFYLWSMINNTCENLYPGADPSTPELYAATIGGLRQVREIHYTTMTQKPTDDSRGASLGYLFSFNKATGVLTMALSTAIASGPNNFGPTGPGIRTYVAQYIK